MNNSLVACGLEINNQWAFQHCYFFHGFGNDVNRKERFGIALMRRFIVDFNFHWFFFLGSLALRCAALVFFVDLTLPPLRPRTAAA